MLTTLNIDHFRGIENLELGELGQINIIAGPNNSGKTSILEVIESLKATNALYTWSSIGRRNSLGTDAVTVYEAIDSLFSAIVDKNQNVIGYSGALSNKEAFTVEIKRSFGKTLVETMRAQKADAFEDMFNNDIESSYDFDIMMDYMGLEYIINSVSVNKDLIIPRQKKYAIQNNENLQHIIDNVIYISPMQHNQNIMFLNYILSKPVLFERFVKVMKKFDSNFMSVNAVENSRGYMYMVLSQNHTKALTLNAYGDGMKKAMLLGAVIKAENGILLLDEFETAIHVSAMKDVFKWIIETALDLNAQIFMTSHSLEAIEAVLTSNFEKQQCIRMLTLANVNGQVRTRNVDGGKALQLLNEYGLELR